MWRPSWWQLEWTRIMSSDRISLPTRLNVWRAIIMVSLVVLVVALFRLQVLQSDLYVNLAARNRLRLVRMPPARGGYLTSTGLFLPPMSRPST